MSMKYRITGFDVPADGVVEVPDNVIPLNTLYNPTTGLLTLACLQIIEGEPASRKVESKTEDDLSDKGSEERHVAA